MKISYVLPVHNGQTTIARCIQSLLNQRVKPHEIFVIDDCSTDNNSEIIKNIHFEFVKRTINQKIPYKFFYNQYTKRMGSAKIRNEFNAMCTGDIIAVCDCDIYYKDRSKAILEFFKNNKDKDIFYSGLHLKDSKSPNTYDGYMAAYEWDFKSKCPISHPTVAYRRKVVKKIKYKELTLESDLYEFFLLDAHKAGFKFGGCQNALMIKTEGNSSRNKEEAAKIKAKLYKEYKIKT